MASPGSERDASGTRFVHVGMASFASGATFSNPGWTRLFAEPPAGRADPLQVDRAATFEEVYRAHFRDVYRYVLVMSHRPDEADDVVAEVFTRAFHAWRDGRGPAGRPLPWLLLVTRRLLTDRWRRGRLVSWVRLGGEEETGRAKGTSGFDRLAGEREFWMWLDAVSRAVPERQREVLLLRYQRDLSDGEIGEVLGLSESGVRSLAARAIASLRRHPELWS